MAFDVGSVVAKVTADIGDFKSKMKEAENSANGLRDGLGKVGGFLGDVSKQSAILAGVVGGGLVLALKDSVDAYKESQISLSQQAAVLASTHHAAGLYAEDLNDQAMALQRLTPFSDEAVRSTQNMLLTFTNLKGGVMQQATGAALDMATAMNGGLAPATEDVRAKAILLGKALQDPDAGLGALHRVGVNVDELKKQFTSSMTVQEKQVLILKELGTEFGGSAAAAGQTFAGKMAILKNMVNELQESMGKFLIDALTPVVSALTAFATNQGVISFFQNLRDAAAGFVEAFKTDDAGKMSAALEKLGAPQLTEPLGRFAGFLRDLGNWIMANKALVITFLEGLGIALGVLLVVGTITALLMAFTNPLVLAAMLIAALFTAYQTNFLGIRDITNVVVTEVMHFFNDILMPGIQLLVKWVKDNWLQISLITDGTWKIIVGLIQLAWGIVYGILSVGIALLSGNWKKAWEDLKHACDIAWGGIKSIFSGAIEFILGWGAGMLKALVQPFEDAWKKISDLVNKIKDALDFTKRHSPSVVDIVQTGVKLVNQAFDDLTMPVAGVGAGAISGGGFGVASAPAFNSINVDMSGAIVSDDATAQAMGERIGDGIIRKLQQNVKF